MASNKTHVLLTHMANNKTHVLLVTFPAQGHINPTLHFARRLLSMGIDVTFSTSVYALRRMSIAKTASKQAHGGLTFTGFSDGFDDNGFNVGVDDATHYMSEIKARGLESLRETIRGSAEQGRPVTCLVYTLLLPWASQVAQEANIPCALLWIQPATVLDVYYWYFHGYKDEIENATDGDKISLPGVVELSRNDLPSFLLPSTSYIYALSLALFEEQIRILDRAGSTPKVLVNTFDALETDALKAIKNYDLIGVGPLIPPAFVDSADSADKSFRGDLFNESVDYLDWLDSKGEASVVYVSFGSLLKLQKPQLEELAKGLLECGRPFVWVIRENNSSNGEEVEKLSCLEELEQLGKIVPWCSQFQVLTHPSLGCFVTHCGWNSTLESISCGVPIVAFPQWSDQGTNAKLIEDVWRIGVRVRPNNEDKGLFESGEIRRCIEEVMDRNGPKAKELRENAIKWKDLSREALQENGSSYVNLKAFFDMVEA